MAASKNNSSLQLANKMHEVMDELLENAQKLIDLSRGAATAEDLQPEQDHQEQLILQLNQLDEQLTEETKGKAEETHPIKMKELYGKMDEFAVHNQTFIDNLSIRRELINTEILENKKALKAISDVRTAYTKKTSTNKKSAAAAAKSRGEKGPKRINTVS